MPAARSHMEAQAQRAARAPGRREEREIGIIVQGGLFNGLNSRLALAGLSDVYGGVETPTLVLNVVHPLVPEEISGFCAGKKAVLIVEEGSPDFIEQAIGQILRKADLNTRLHGKDVFVMAGEYTPLVIGKGLSRFLDQYGRKNEPLEQWAKDTKTARRSGESAHMPLPPRPPTSAPAARSGRCFRP